MKKTYRKRNGIGGSRAVNSARRPEGKLLEVIHAGISEFRAGREGRKLQKSIKREPVLADETNEFNEEEFFERVERRKEKIRKMFDEVNKGMPEFEAEQEGRKQGDNRDHLSTGKKGDTKRGIGPVDPRKVGVDAEERIFG